MALGLTTTFFQQGFYIASGAVTSYSTWTSTSYYYLTSYWTTTDFVTNTFITDRLVQFGPYGYVEIALKYKTPDWPGISPISVDVLIKNPRDIPIKIGSFTLWGTFLVRGWAIVQFRLQQEHTFVPVGSRKEMMLKIQVDVPTYSSFLLKELDIHKVEIALEGPTEMTSVVPITTYTRSRTLTETYVRTYTSIYVTTVPYETQEPFTLGGTGIVVAVVAVGVAVAILAYVRTRKGAHIIAPTPVAIKYCINCGTSIPEQAKRCAKCGATQE